MIKSNRYYALTGIILLIIFGSVFYFTSVSRIHERNFKAFSMLKPGSVEFQPIELTTTETVSLFAALASLTDAANTDIQTDYEHHILLTNKWGRTWRYNILYTEDHTVYLHKNNSGRIYRAANPEFFYHHQLFSGIYEDRGIADITISVAKREVPYLFLDYSWRLLRHDQEWVYTQTDTQKAAQKADELIISSSANPIQVASDKLPDNAQLMIRNSLSDEIVFDGEAELGRLPYPSNNGRYHYRLTITWNDAAKPYQGQSVLEFTVSLDFPETFLFSKQTLIQGDLLEIMVSNVDNPQDIYFEQSIYEGFRWYAHDQLLRGYLPTNYNTKPGVYTIKYGNLKKGTENLLELEIKAFDYQVQRLTVSSKTVQETQNKAAYAEFAKFFTPSREQSAPTRYYTEPFAIPAKGKLTTEFGQIRYINNSPNASRHSGLDIAAPTGTDIVATNRGKVVLSMYLTITGNTLVIDHGEGLFSIYYHMHENYVQEGEIVERGQKIAAMGTTGFSTGPHLHFMISYYKMNIDPGFLLAGEPITFANYLDYLQ